MVYVGCGGGSSSSSSSGSSGINISGVLDNYTLVSLPPDENNFLDRFCRMFSPQRAYAQALGSDVNRIIGISSRGNTYSISEATLTSNSFSLSVSKDKPYLLVLLYNTSIVGVYKVDDDTDLDAFPLNSASSWASP